MTSPVSPGARTLATSLQVIEQHSRVLHSSGGGEERARAHVLRVVVGTPLTMRPRKDGGGGG